MKRLHKLVAGLVLAAMAIGTIGIFATASAANTRLTVVNGRAGGKVDACIDGKKVIKKLAYGSKVVRLTNNQPHTLKFVAAGKGCGSKSLGKLSYDADPSGADATVVLTKRSPRIAVFDNEEINEQVGPEDAALAWRHAADLGAVVFKYSFIEPPDPISPSATVSPNPVWVKGDEYVEGFSEANFLIKLKATRPEKTKALAKNGAFRRYIAPYRKESILVGDKARNARFVNFKIKNRPASPSPSATP